MCEDCGYGKYPEILHVHHIDRNRNNNDLTNLRLLCPTCHETEHFLAGDGKFKKRNMVEDIGVEPIASTLQGFHVPRHIPH